LLDMKSVLRTNAAMDDAVHDNRAVKSLPSTPDFRSSIITAKTALENNKKAKDMEHLARPDIYLKGGMRHKIEAEQRAFLTKQSKEVAIDALKAELKYEIIDGLKKDLRDDVVNEMKDELRNQVMTELKEELRGQAFADLKRDILHGDEKEIRLKLFNEVTAALDAEHRIPAQEELKRQIDEEFRTMWEVQIRDDTIEEIRGQLGPGIESELRAELGPRIHDQLYRKMHAEIDKHKAHLERMVEADVLAEWTPQLEAQLKRYEAAGDKDRRRSSWPEATGGHAQASSSRSHAHDFIDLIGEERQIQFNDSYGGFYVDKLITTDELAHGLPDDNYEPVPHASSAEHRQHLTNSFTRANREEESLFVSEDEADIEEEGYEGGEHNDYDPLSPPTSTTSSRFQPGELDDLGPMRSESEEYASRDDIDSHTPTDNPHNGSYGNGDNLPDYEDSDDEQPVNHVPNPHYPYGLRTIPAEDYHEYDEEDTLHEPAAIPPHYTHTQAVEYDEEQTAVDIEDARLAWDLAIVNVLKRSHGFSSDEEDEFGLYRPHGPTKRMRKEYHGGTNDAAMYAEIREYANIGPTHESEEETEIDSDEEAVQGVLKELAPFGAYAQYGMAEYGTGEEGYGDEDEDGEEVDYNGEGYDGEDKEDGEAENEQTAVHDLRGTSENNAIDLDSD
ncbi:MAG: hypothetical protein Q9187_000972, partial [Circinaria calcarea]